MNMPNFDEWAETIKLSRYPNAIREGLRQAFEQGRHYGKREIENKEYTKDINGVPPYNCYWNGKPVNCSDL